MYRFILSFALTLSACGEGVEYPAPRGVDDGASLDECTPGDRRINADGAIFHCDAHGQWACQASTHPEGNDNPEFSPDAMVSTDSGVGDGKDIGDVDRDDLTPDGSAPDDGHSADPNPDTPSPDDPTPDAPSPDAIPEGQCPEGALWLDQLIPGNENAAEGLEYVTFQPNESKYFCSRLPPERGNAKRLRYGFSGHGNDHTCESMMMEVVSVPPESTADRSRLATNELGYRSANVAVAFYLRDSDVGMDAPPGLYVIKATELFGERDPGQRVCRRFQIFKLLIYP